MTTHVASVDWSFADHPCPNRRPAQGSRARSSSVPGQGAVHTELAVTVLHPGGWLQRHFHSFEEALYVLAGELLIESWTGTPIGLRPGDFALSRIGTWHALANAGTEPVRLLSVNTPLRLPPDAGRQGHLLRDRRRSTSPRSTPRPSFRPSATRGCAGSVTTTARRRRRRPSPWTIRHGAVVRPGATPRSSCTAASA